MLGGESKQLCFYTPLAVAPTLGISPTALVYIIYKDYYCYYTCPSCCVISVHRLRLLSIIYTEENIDINMYKTNTVL